MRIVDCGGKRKRDTAFEMDFRRASAVVRKRRNRPRAAPSEGGVALTLPAAVPGCAAHGPLRRVAIPLSKVHPPRKSSRPAAAGDMQE